MLTEKETWLKIAEWFKTFDRNSIRTIEESPKFLPEIEYRACDGICICIYQLARYEYITKELGTQMQDKIRKVKPSRKAELLYKWSFTKNGDLARVKFCLERAAEL
jgi:hypothetical protein